MHRGRLHGIGERNTGAHPVSHKIDGEKSLSLEMLVAVGAPPDSLCASHDDQPTAPRDTNSGMGDQSNHRRSHPAAWTLCEHQVHRGKNATNDNHVTARRETTKTMAIPAI